MLYRLRNSKSYLTKCTTNTHFKFYNRKDINYAIKITGEIIKFLCPFKNVKTHTSN